MLERDLERKLKKAVESRGGMCFKLHPFSAKGIPDRLAIYPGGRVDFIELKTESGRVAPAQARFLSRLRDYGCNAMIVKGEAGLSEYMLLLDCEQVLKEGAKHGRV